MKKFLLVSRNKRYSNWRKKLIIFKIEIVPMWHVNKLKSKQGTRRVTDTNEKWIKKKHIIETLNFNKWT